MNTQDRIENGVENTNEEADTAKTARKPWFTMFIAWLALFLTVIGIMAGYKNWLHIHNKTKDNQVKLSDVEATLDGFSSTEQLKAIEQTVNEKLINVEEQSAKQLKKMQQLMQEAEHYTESMESQIAGITRLQGQLQRNATPASSKDWILSDTEYLLRMANRQLHFNKDKASTIALLKEADTNLASLGEPHYLPVRQQLAKDIALLEQWAAPDTASILQAITALGLQIQPLPVMDVNLEEGEEKTLLDVEEQDGQTPDIWTDMKKQLKDAVTIRKFDKPIKAAMDADSRLQLHRLLQLRIETLKQLVLHADDEQYHQQVTLIKETIQTYYPENSQKSLLESLQALDKEQLSPAVPDIRGSMQQFNAARQTEERSVNTQQGEVQ
jgi:uroporphyrin-3 C-methyltransferase